jgi:predicted DNA-binding WGR domain protein
MFVEEFEVHRVFVRRGIEATRLTKQFPNSAAAQIDILQRVVAQPTQIDVQSR